MNETLSNCPVCNSINFELFLKTTDFSITKEIFTLVQCKNCSFVFTNPRPDQKSINHYYESDDYISHSNSNRGLINKIYQIVRSFSSKWKLKLISSLAQGDKSILDVGCGTGTFLNECKKDGWFITGIEPSKNAREIAFREYGLEINDESKILDLQPKSFQIITLWHVLEHVHSLNKRIGELNMLLKDNGKILIALPNYKSYDATFYKEFWAGYDIPRHLYHFSKKNIVDLFEKSGFKYLESIPMKFDSYYVSLLSEKYKKTRLSLFKGVYIGLKSNLKAKKNTEKFSSVIYVFSKS